MQYNLLNRLTLAVALAFVTSALAQTNPVAAGGSAGPHIVFATPVFDFGKADAGESVKHDYVFTNAGDQTLIISNVHPGCGCTTAGSWDKQVEPGKTGKISIQFNSSGYGGAVQKTVSVTCNDPSQGTITLQLKGTVWKAFTVAPNYTVFNLAPDNQGGVTNVVRITSNLDEPVTVSDPTCNNPAFKAEVKTVTEGKEFELRVMLVSPVGIGSMNAPITLKTSSAKTPTISVPAYVMVQPILSIIPNQINLPSGPLTNAQPVTITVQNNSTNPMALSEPGINWTNVDIQIKEMQPDRRVNMLVTFPEGYQNPSGQNVELTVKSGNPRYPLIKIPVIQQIRAPLDSQR